VILTGYQPPTSDDEIPTVVTLSNEAARYLAELPVRAYGTDSFSVEALEDTSMPSIHHIFLERGIPVYEQLLNVEALLGRAPISEEAVIRLDAGRRIAIVDVRLEEEWMFVTLEALGLGERRSFGGMGAE